MLQAKKAGLRGGKGSLEVSGKLICPYCKGDIKKMAIQLELEELTIRDANDSVYKFNKSDLAPVKKGGKGYKGTCL